VSSFPLPPPQCLPLSHAAPLSLCNRGGRGIQTPPASYCITFFPLDFARSLLPDGETEAEGGREVAPGEALPPGSLTTPAHAPDLAAGRLGTLSLF
jgi:hypothetical protein